ncbi:MAG: hypothetical protein V4474_01985 [Patescibacteria group bacterium]
MDIGPMGDMRLGQISEAQRVVNATICAVVLIGGGILLWNVDTERRSLVTMIFTAACFGCAANLTTERVIALLRPRAIRLARTVRALEVACWLASIFLVGFGATQLAMTAVAVGTGIWASTWMLNEKPAGTMPQSNCVES